MRYKPQYRMVPRASNELESNECTRSREGDTIGLNSCSASTSRYTAFNPHLHGPRINLKETRQTSGTDATTIPTTYPATTYEPLSQTHEPPSPSFHTCVSESEEPMGTLYQDPIAWANSTQFAEHNTATTQDARSSPPPTYDAQLLEMGLQQQQQKQYFRPARHLRMPWRSGAWRRFPAKGIIALLAVLTLTGAAAAVLCLADGTGSGEWKLGGGDGGGEDEFGGVQPAVYISILEMCMDVLVSCALWEGVVVRFWKGVSRGCTITDIHDSYESSFFWPAVRAILGLRSNRVATATLLAILSTARGPLFQQSLTLRNGIYHTNLIFVVVGATLSLISVVAILPLYYGYWELGRSVSLNPLETARAFGAPLLDGVDGNVGADDILMERGHLAVKYGAVERVGYEKVLRIENAKLCSVRIPWDGEIFG